MGYYQIMQNKAKQSRGLETPFRFAGAPTNGGSGTYVKLAVVGSQLVDSTNGKNYVATVADGSTVTWVSVGSQT